MLTAKVPAASNKSCDALARPIQMSTKGGSSDTEVNAFTVSPKGAPAASRVATTVTPVGYDAITDRSEAPLVTSGWG